VHGWAKGLGLAAGTLLATMSLAACGGGAGTLSDWTTPTDVVDALRSHDFACSESASAEPSIGPGYDSDGNQTDATTLITCEGFTVVLIHDADRVQESDLKTCEAATADVWKTWDERSGVTGPNWAILPTGSDNAFPENAQPADFVKAARIV